VINLLIATVVMANPCMPHKHVAHTPHQTPACLIAPPCGAQTTGALDNVKLTPLYPDLDRYLYMPGMPPTEAEAFPAGSSVAPGWQGPPPVQIVPIGVSVPLPSRAGSQTPELDSGICITAFALLMMALLCTFDNRRPK
jgi:hypothetical protein